MILGSSEYLERIYEIILEEEQDPARTRGFFRAATACGCSVAALDSLLP